MVLVITDYTVESLWIRIKDEKKTKRMLYQDSSVNKPSQDDIINELSHKKLKDISRSAAFVLIGNSASKTLTGNILQLTQTDTGNS